MATKLAADQVSGARVTALDISPLMLARAEASARAAGVAGSGTETGPFEMMTPRGFLADEGLPRCLAIMGQVAGRPAYARKMAWLMPCMAKAVPYLGYVLVAGTKPA